MRRFTQFALGMICIVWTMMACDSGPNSGGSHAPDGTADQLMDTAVAPVFMDQGVATPIDGMLPIGSPDMADRPVDRDSGSVPVPTDASLVIDADTVIDTEAPFWPEGASFFAERIQQQDALLAWSHAIDDHGISTYRIYQAGQEVGQVPAHQTSYVANGLLEGVRYSFGVVAEDAAGHRSDMLPLTFMTSDRSAPTWSENALLRAVNVGETTATLSWPAARDNVSVTRYRVLLDDRIIVETAALSAQFDALSAMTTYRAEVVAIDGAGNPSNANPTVQFTTSDVTAPQFAEGAVLVLHDPTPRQVRVSWQAAIDNVAVTGYEVSLDGAQLGRVNADTRTYTVDNLRAGTRVTVSVSAFDALGNMSVAGPRATFATGDDTPPTWPDQAVIRASNIMPDSLTLAWTPAMDDVGVTAYTVTQNGQLLGESAIPQIAVHQLTPWMDYTFTVRAYDALGNVSAVVLSLDVRTPDRVQPSWNMGEQLTALDVTPSSLTLTWPGATDDVSVVAYEISQDAVLLGRVDGATTQILVDQLRPWTEYTFRVNAIDQADNRSATPLSLTQRTADTFLPTWPNGVLTTGHVTSTSLTLQWTAATDDVAVTAYSVQQDGVELARLDGATLNVAVNGLTPWTDYTFAVRAEDAAGNVSAEAVTVAQKTPDAAAPTFPVDASLVTVDVTSTAATVRWPAADDDVAVVRYEVTVDGAPQPAIGGQTTEIQLSQLRAMRAYLVAVRAFDAAGNSSAELTTTVNTPDGGAPTWGGARLTGTAGISEIQLSWDAAQDDVAVTAYRVFQADAQLYEGPTRQFLVESLTPETGYMFRVEAGDAAGHWSADGPTLQVTTAKAFDPGFRRLTKDQFTRTRTDLMGKMWLETCRHPANACGDPNHPWYRDPDTLFRWVTGINNRAVQGIYPDDILVDAAGHGGRGFGRLDSVVYPAHVSSWVTAAMQTAETDYRGWIGAWIILNGCIQDSNGNLTIYSPLNAFETCASVFFHKLGKGAFRRPLTAEESAFFLDTFREVAQAYRGRGLSGLDLAKYGLRNVIATMLLSPQFMYHVELGDENGRLTAWELASRLSYHFWNTMPDDELFSAAEDGSLLTEEGYEAQVDRLFSDPKATRAINEFYKDFFEVREIPEVNLNRQDGPSFDGWKRNYLSGANVGEHRYPGFNPAEGIDMSMQRELLNLGHWFTVQSPGTFEEMFRSNLHFMPCPDQGRCYGTAPWALYSYGINGVCDDYADCDSRDWNSTGQGWNGVDQPMELPEPSRAGLITRMSMLAHNTIYARPIRRGLKIREMLLCDPVPPPENCDVVKPPNLTGICESEQGSTGQSCSDDQHCGPGEICVGWDREVSMTVREKVEELTETPGTSCAGCHATLINGFGHALGHFSSVGEYWEREHMFDSRKNAQGDFLYDVTPPEEWPEIDTSGSTIFDGQRVNFDGPHEVADLLVESGRMEWCFSREYFRFSLGREEWESDAETIETIAERMRNGMTLGEAFKAIVYTPQFRSLYKPPALAAPAGDAP